MSNIDRPPAFVPITCQCGRSLRAKFDQVGAEIQCWDCQKMVPVPVPRQSQRIVRELSDGALGVMKGPGLNMVLAAGAVLTAVLCLPFGGLWVAMIVATLGASAYGEIIRRFSRGPVEEPDPDWKETLLPRSVPKVILCLTMAAGTIVPLWMLNANVAKHQSPHFDLIGVVLAALAWTVLPLLMMIVYSRNREGSLGARKCLMLLARHPIATGAALVVVPATLVMLEAFIGSILYILGDLPFFALDFLPMPTKPVPPLVHGGLVYYGHLDYRSFPESKYITSYFDALQHGYSFVGAVPASLSLSTRVGLESEAIGLLPLFYTLARAFLVMLIVTCLVTAFGIQARWIGTIPSLDRRRPA